LLDCKPKEIHLQIIRFTWSNKRLNPALFKLDDFFQLPMGPML
jgi:hypothetical protein